MGGKEKNKKILCEGEIRVAISEEGAIVSGDCITPCMILPILKTLDQMHPDAFSKATFEIAAMNLFQSLCVEGEKETPGHQ